MQTLFMDMTTAQLERYLLAFVINVNNKISRRLHAIEQNRTLMAAAFKYEIQGQPDFGIKEVFTPSKSKYKNLLFLIGTSKDEKLWQINRWSELANKGLSKGYKVELIWGNDKEKNLGLEIRKQVPNAFMADERLSIAGVAQKLSSATGVVGLDSGFTHLSGAMEIPTIALFGPTSPDKFGLIGANTSNLTHMNTLSSNVVWSALQDKMC